MSRRRKPQNHRKPRVEGAPVGGSAVPVQEHAGFWGTGEGRNLTNEARDDAELADSLREDAGQAVGWNIGRMLVVCMKLMPKTPGESGFLAVAKPSVAAGRPNLQYCDLGRGLTALGVLGSEQASQSTDINKDIVGVFAKAGIKAGGAVVPMFDIQTGRRLYELLAVVNGKIRAMSQGPGGWKWLQGAGGRMSAEDLIDFTLAEAAKAAGVEVGDRSQVFDNGALDVVPQVYASEREACEEAGSKLKWTPVTYAWVVQMAARAVAAQDPERHPLAFVDALGGLRVCVLGALQAAGVEDASSGREAEDNLVAKAFADEQRRVDNCWPGFLQFLGSTADSVLALATAGKGDEEKTELFKLMAWVGAATFAWRVSPLDFVASCQKVEAAWNHGALLGSFGGEA